MYEVLDSLFYVIFIAGLVLFIVGSLGWMISSIRKGRRPKWRPYIPTEAPHPGAIDDYIEWDEGG